MTWTAGIESVSRGSRRADGSARPTLVKTEVRRSLHSPRDAAGRRAASCREPPPRQCIAQHAMVCKVIQARPSSEWSPVGGWEPLARSAMAKPGIRVLRCSPSVDSHSPHYHQTKTKASEQSISFFSIFFLLISLFLLSSLTSHDSRSRQSLSFVPFSQS